MTTNITTKLQSLTTETLTPETLATSMNDLGQAFQDFKQKQDEKLTTLEKKLHQQNLVHLRPQTNLQMATADTPDTKAFQNFVRAGLDAKALSTTEGPSGGFLIPQIIQDRINRAVKEQGSLRNLAQVTTISSSSVDVLLNKNLPDIGWAAELDARDETATAELVKINIPTHEMYAKPRASQKLLDDAAINVEEWLVQRIAERMNRLENDAFINGDGDKKPKGFLKHPSSAHEEFDKIQYIIAERDRNLRTGALWDYLLRLQYSLKAKYLTGAVWLMSRTMQQHILNFRDTRGRFLWQPSIATGVPSTLFGYPVYISDEMPDFRPGTPSAPIAFGNFGEAYQIVDRTDMQVLRDPYSAKPYVEFYVTKRVGGAVVNAEALKVLSFSKEVLESAAAGGGGAAAGAAATEGEESDTD